MSGQLHAPASSPKGKVPPAPTGWENLAPQTRSERVGDKSLVPAGNLPLVLQPTTLTLLSLLSMRINNYSLIGIFHLE